MANDLTISKGLLQTEDSEYVRLVSLISGVWDKAREKAALSVNTELLDASWATGRYIVEYEQHSNIKAEYGKQLLTNLSKDLTRLRGKGYSRSNLFNMRLFYVRFPKIQTVSGQLTWSNSCWNWDVVLPLLAGNMSFLSVVAVSRWTWCSIMPF